MFNFFQASLNSGIRESTNSLGFFPFFKAANSIFFPCSSVPVRKKTSSFFRECHLAKTSAAIVVYACPICGMSLG